MGAGACAGEGLNHCWRRGLVGVLARVRASGRAGAAKHGLVRMRASGAGDDGGGADNADGDGGGGVCGA